MKRERTEEWDWPPTRQKLPKGRWVRPEKFHHRPIKPRTRHRYQSRFDVYQPSGWNSSVNKKIIDVGWRVMVTIIKVFLTITLTIIAFGASWLIVTVLTL
jgi:hypothetical protein